MLQDTLNDLWDFGYNQFDSKSRTFCYIKAYVFWKFNELPTERCKTYEPKKIPNSNKVLQKSHISIFRELQLIIVFFDLRFFYGLKQKVLVAETCLGFPVLIPCTLF